MVSAVKIVKSYGSGAEKQRILDQVDIGIEKGEFVAIMGPSGSGKTTLLYALSGMDSIDGGSVHFNGQNLSELSENQLADLRRTRMGFIFQQPTLLKNLNLLDNIILPTAREKKSIAKAVKMAKNLMEKTGIATYETRDITQVSGGQLQRAGICRALMNTPDVIFGDEPTGALNSKSADEIMDILENINEEGTAIVLVTHDVKVAARTQRIVFLYDGRIVSEMVFKNENMDKRVEMVNKKMAEIGI